MSHSSNESIQPRFRTVEGLSVRFAESEDRGEDALLLSPWPESLFAYRPTWSRLAEHHHLVAIDLPGFGHSERRDALMSPRAMGEFLLHVAEAFGLDHPHVVGPDVGTGAALFAAALHPGKWRSLVVGSGGAAFPLQLGGVLKEWVEDADIERYRGADPRAIVAAALATLERYVIPDDITEDYLSAYEGDRFVESMSYVRTYPTDLRALGDLLPGIQTPVQHIAGGRDGVVPPANSEYLHARLPHSKLDIVDAGHFTWEDAADAYAAIVTAWWDGGYAATGSGSVGARRGRG
ncbi:alpha/beta fold hydrolase [Streptomyces sp. NPDC087420]|uniref:alpha/beta fold hydrolase n=1 Tax=Streptomyces sp. NPDC087420 TaxID=3365785 RepID=UPI003836F1DA